ncbi:MAG: hypothetical protein WBZ54_00930, partial [Methylocella sp.]
MATRRGATRLELRRIFLNLRPPAALLPFAAFARLRGVFRPGTEPRTALPAGDGAWMEARDVAKHSA